MSNQGLEINLNLFQVLRDKNKINSQMLSPILLVNLSALFNFGGVVQNSLTLSLSFCY